MIKLNKILVPTDFSKGAEKAYSIAQKVADKFGGTIDLIHVIPTLKYLNESIKQLGVPIDMNKDVYPKILDESEHLLQKAMENYFAEKNRGKHIVKIDRKVADFIANHSSNNGYDLIVMGAKGKHETSLVRGSTTEKIIRKSKVPVFSVDDRMSGDNIEQILMPTDSSELSIAAFPMAASLADAFKAKLTLLHIVELYGSVSEDIPRTPEKGEMVSVYEGIIERINTFLLDKGYDNIHIQRTGVTYEDEVTITDGEKSRSISLYSEIKKGISAHYEIENYAAEHADLVVMATHGHSGFAHLILGSTAEKVAQYVKKPVITIRPEM